VLVFRGAFPGRNQNVDVATTRTETVRSFRACVLDVDHFSLNSAGPIGGPAITVVSWLKQRVEGDSRIEVSGLRRCNSIF
jgi:hypothetical protein